MGTGRSGKQLGFYARMFPLLFYSHFAFPTRSLSYCPVAHREQSEADGIEGVLT